VTSNSRSFEEGRDEFDDTLDTGETVLYLNGAARSHQPFIPFLPRRWSLMRPAGLSDAEMHVQLGRALSRGAAYAWKQGVTIIEEGTAA
jgi:hypothetical protein